MYNLNGTLHIPGTYIFLKPQLNSKMVSLVNARKKTFYNFKRLHTNREKRVGERVIFIQTISRTSASSPIQISKPHNKQKTHSPLFILSRKDVRLSVLVVGTFWNFPKLTQEHHSRISRSASKTTRSLFFNAFLPGCFYKVYAPVRKYTGGPVIEERKKSIVFKRDAHYLGNLFFFFYILFHFFPEQLVFPRKPPRI